MEAEPGRSAWFATQELRNSQSAGTCRRLPPRWLESRTGLVPHSDEPRARAGIQTRVVPLPTGAGSAGVKSGATRDDETRVELHAIPRKAAARTGVEATGVEAEVRARAARIRSGIVAKATGSRIEIAFLVD